MTNMIGRYLRKLLFLFPMAAAHAGDGYAEVGNLPSPYATQAAVADGQFVYAVASKEIAKYDRASGEKLAVSEGAASHLNSAVIMDGKVYCAHSNFPKLPEEGDIRVLDPVSMKLTVFHRFENPPGSVTWVLRKDGNWWCHFAHYGLGNSKSVLVRFDAEWKETGRWNYPSDLVKDWGKSSLSGGIWKGDTLLVSGHDKKLIYQISVPKNGETVEWNGALRSPFPGQGLAEDFKTGGLVGIHRGKKQVVFAMLEKVEGP
jgi:hypothetical protein